MKLEILLIQSDIAMLIICRYVIANYKGVGLYALALSNMYRLRGGPDSNILFSECGAHDRS